MTNVRMMGYSVILVIMLLGISAFTAMMPRAGAPRAEVTDDEFLDAPPAAPASRLTPELERRRAELWATGEALAREHKDLGAEERALDALRRRIEGRRGQYPDGLPPGADADDRLV